MLSVFPGHQIIRLEQTTSTNPTMLQLSLQERLSEGTVVLTQNQTQGRGQGNNSWESEPYQNLTFSIILYPVSLNASSQFQLSKVISLGVRDFLSQYVSNVCVKWPNDVYVGNQKITGMLIENFIEGAYLTKSIAGIGVNINQANFISNAPNPVSLHQLTGNTYNLDICLNELIGYIGRRYQMLSDKQVYMLDSDYLKYLYRFGQLSNFSTGDSYFEATITGVNKYGMLEMTTVADERKTFGFKEVAFV